MALSLSGTTGIVTGNIAALQVTTATIADDNVTTAKILNANVTPAKLSQPMTLGTAKTYNWNGLTTNTSLEFTGIPSWAKRITVMFNGVSTNGASPVVARLGTSSGIVSTSYFGSAGGCLNGAPPLVVNLSNGSGLYITPDGSASYGRHGQILISNIHSNSWSMAFNGSDDGSARVFWGCVSHTNLGGTLDRVRITTVNGTDTFDAGSVNIMYEG